MIALFQRWREPHAGAKWRVAVATGLLAGAMSGLRDAEAGCGELEFHGDGTYEDGVCWSTNQIAPPETGAFASCFAGEALVCAINIDVTQVGFGDPVVVDVLLWGDDAGHPGAMLYSVENVDLGYVEVWPAVSRKIVILPEPVCVAGEWWIGVWQRSNTGYCASYIAADTSGPEECTMTNIAPGHGLPGGWQPISVAWPDVKAIGLGVERAVCTPVPVSGGSWGAVKHHYGVASPGEQPIPVGRESSPDAQR